MGAKILETNNGYICLNCGTIFLFETFKNVSKYTPERTAFYQALYHNCD